MVCTLIIGFTISPNIVAHIYVLAVHIVTPYVWVPLFLVLPAVLLVVTWVRKLAGGDKA
ncbi:hypothetical protein [Paenibacillus tepidiphilus]|uniref:hypothetical protein n=1 Tax=Paenibacillus tepidiphilus TaxID=2608683 RepID=UPI0013A58667|nr:hypothetical protein [Paenibacillus tepidiphilus]